MSDYDLDSQSAVLLGMSYPNWYKIIIPDIDNVFGALLSADITLAPFIYAKLPQGFDVLSTAPYLEAKDPVLAIQPAAGGRALQVIALTQIGKVSFCGENEPTCYISRNQITVVIPINPKCSTASLLEDTIREVSLIAPEPSLLQV